MLKTPTDFDCFRQLESEAIVAAVHALEILAGNRASARNKQEIDNPQLSLSDPHPLPYDPASMFLLETMVSITSQVPEYIEDLWSVV